jgi:hypothetical protein
MNHTSPAVCISVYSDVFSAEDGNQFLTSLEKEISDGWSELSWGNSGVGGEGKVTSHRTSLSCSLIPIMKPYPETDLSRLFDKNIRIPVEQVVEDYRSEHLLPSGIHEPYSILKYSGGAEYHAHYDHFRDNARVYSMVAIVAEPEKGGQLEFPFFNVTVEPVVGTVILFPSNFPYIHIAHPVESGVKCSMVTWYM